MGDRYDRAAGSLAELQEVPFPNLALAMPESRAVLQARLARGWPLRRVCRLQPMTSTSSIQLFFQSAKGGT
jgi:hypothetical protein